MQHNGSRSGQIAWSQQPLHACQAAVENHFGLVGRARLQQDGARLLKALHLKALQVGAPVRDHEHDEQLLAAKTGDRVVLGAVRGVPGGPGRGERCLSRRRGTRPTPCVRTKPDVALAARRRAICRPCSVLEDTLKACMPMADLLTDYRKAGALPDLHVECPNTQ